MPARTQPAVPLRTQGQAVAIAVLKGIHLFFNHVGYFADRAFE